MRISEYYEHIGVGTNNEPTTETLIYPTKDDTSIFGMIEAGTYYGESAIGQSSEIACLAAMAVEEVATKTYEKYEDAMFRAKDLRRALYAVHEKVTLAPEAAQNRLANGYVTLTAALLSGNQLAVPYVGNNEAYFIPDKGEPIELTDPHDTTNLEDRLYARRRGVDVVEVNGLRLFGGKVGISRCIGGQALNFATGRIEIGFVELRSTGWLAIGNSQFWRDRIEDCRSISRVLDSTNEDPAALMTGRNPGASLVVALVEA